MNRLTDFDCCDSERNETAVAVMNQQICSNLIGSEVINTTSTIRNISHDDHLNNNNTVTKRSLSKQNRAEERSDWFVD